MINYIISKSNIIINYVGFTIVWFSCVYSGAEEDPIIALIPTFIFLFLHLLFVTDHLKEEIQLIVIAIIFGLIVDSSFSLLGFVEYKGTLDFAPRLAPPWIVCMWAGFTAQINHVMKFLIGRYALIFFYGLLAPLAYIGGESIGAAVVTDTPLSYGFISMAWAISLLSLFKISEYLISK
tara:strand:- start:1068 stop:1604 length:537 start_codon:yes stop_codon:yes gene_type:complete